jgi:hypothetical protein
LAEFVHDGYVLFTAFEAIIFFWIAWQPMVLAKLLLPGVERRPEWIVRTIRLTALACGLGAILAIALRLAQKR